MAHCEICNKERQYTTTIKVNEQGTVVDKTVCNTCIDTVDNMVPEIHCCVVCPNKGHGSDRFICKITGKSKEYHENMVRVTETCPLQNK